MATAGSNFLLCTTFILSTLSTYVTSGAAAATCDHEATRVSEILKLSPWCHLPSNLLLYEKINPLCWSHSKSRFSISHSWEHPRLIYKLYDDFSWHRKSMWAVINGASLKWSKVSFVKILIWMSISVHKHLINACHGPGTVLTMNMTWL